MAPSTLINLNFYGREKCYAALPYQLNPANPAANACDMASLQGEPGRRGVQIRWGMAAEPQGGFSSSLHRTTVD
jgi:hypothetical protein